MSNYVTISCLSASPCPLGPTLSIEETVEVMILYWEQQLEQVLPDQPDLIVLPEFCDSPVSASYTLDRTLAYYAYRKNRVRDYLAEVSRKHRCYIAYCAIREEEDGSLRNSIQLIDRAGQVTGIYDKNHPTVEENEKVGILYGKEAAVFDTDFGRVGCVICFDLNFDTLRLQYVQEKPDIIVFSSAYHGGLMQQYWAFSCRAFFAASIHVGAPCAIVSPVGEIIAASTNYYHFVTRKINLDCKVIHIDKNHEHFRDIKNKYGNKVLISDPGYLGAVMISSESDEFTVMDILAEFGLETLDDYFARSQAHRRNLIEVGNRRN